MQIMMKKLLGILVLVLIFSFQSLTKADDIREFEIEGMTIGDSLLDYMSENEIQKEIELNKYMYSYLTDEFGEVYLQNKKYEKYDFVSVFVKPADEEFLIYRISGTMNFNNKIEKCYPLMNEIAEEFSKSFKNSKKQEFTNDHSVDETGRSKTKTISFITNYNNVASVQCMDFEEELRIKNNWADSLTITLTLDETEQWFLKKN